MLQKELETAIVAAKAAGDAILAHYQGDVIEEQKVGADSFVEPVTAADREASRIIVETLLNAFPGDGILSEEEDDDIHHRLGRDRVWIIDPIDGTAGFLKKDGDFAVQIGLAEIGKPVLGVVLLPFHGVLYHAVTGQGAFRTNGDAGERIAVSQRSDFSSMYLAVSRNHRSPKMSRIVNEFAFRSEVQRGSVGLKIGLIAEQECDVYIHLSPRTKLWDTCAPQIILEEAGGRLTDLWGGEYRYDRGDVQNWGGIVASNGVVHDHTIQRLRPLLNEFGRHKIKSHAGQ
ncbi:MAG: 3'(2'),5'-bisphosphate nucleotidase CysQ [Pyrinomonadaceae bacterium]|nr:3'(2'),5'-bisphosphate nucleotidase CysQ [Pyrinomonadaceae bacterium]